MKRITLVLAFGLALAVPTAALAKGPSAAKIEGPGLKQTITLRGREGDSPLWKLAEEAGFFPATFGRSPDPMRKTRPNGELGARYTATYTVPGPDGESVIRQDLYPYAKPAPLTHMQPGQPVWDGQRTYGGWFVSSPPLKATLVEAGLPSAAPGGGFWDVPALVGVSAAALALALLAALRGRRRPARTAPTLDYRTETVFSSRVARKSGPTP